MTLTKFSHAVVLAYGWRRAAIAFVAGAASTLALAPFQIWPILFLTFPLLIWLNDGAATGRLGGVFTAAFTGWFFGFGYFLAGLYWVGYAFLVEAKVFGWLLPIAVIGLPALLSIFPAFGMALARAMWSRGATRVFALAFALTVSEWLRGHLLSGFPWNAYGYALTGPLVLAQGIALIGLWGMTFAAVAIFATPAILTDEKADSKRPWLPLACGLAVLGILASYGALRLWQNPTSYVDNLRIRIVQPNLQQDEKFNYATKQDVLNRYLALSDRATGPQTSGIRDVTHLIWPESAFPFFLNREASALAQIANALAAGTTLITGGVRAADAGPNSKGVRAYNSIYALDHDGSILATYDKVHLVPFGEYLPLQSFLEKLGLKQLTKLPGGFLSGDRYRTIALPGTPPFLPLICYEIIFPGEVVPAAERPAWMLNVTNDGWFGISTGPYQHFHQARMRAIEQGLPLIRAANTGISAVIDPVGRTLKFLPLGQEGILDTALPRQIATPFSLRMGDSLLAMLLGMAGLLAMRKSLRR